MTERSPSGENPPPAVHLHHVHLFAADIDATVAWWREKLGGVVAFDGEFASARNVFMEVGRGRLHLYDQPPRGAPGGAVHHVGIQTTFPPPSLRPAAARGAGRGRASCRHTDGRPSRAPPSIYGARRAVPFRHPRVRVVALHHVRGAGRRTAGALPDRHGQHAPCPRPLFRPLGLRPLDCYGLPIFDPVLARPVSPRPSRSPDKRAVSFSTAVKRAARRPELVRINVASPTPTVAPTATTKTIIAIVPLSMNSSLADSAAFRLQMLARRASVDKRYNGVTYRSELPNRSRATMWR